MHVTCNKFTHFFLLGISTMVFYCSSIIPSQPLSLEPGKLPANDCTVFVKTTGPLYLSYETPENKSKDGKIEVLTLNKKSCPFKLTIIDAKKGTFSLQKPDGTYVVSLVSTVGTDKDAKKDNKETILTLSKKGQISGPVNIDQDIDWYPPHNLSNKKCASNPNYPGWDSTTYAFWTNEKGPLRNCVNKNGKFPPAPEINALIFTFDEVIPTKEIMMQTDVVKVESGITPAPTEKTAEFTTKIVTSTEEITADEDDEDDDDEEYDDEDDEDDEEYEDDEGDDEPEAPISSRM